MLVLVPAASTAPKGAGAQTVSLQVVVTGDNGRIIVSMMSMRSPRGRKPERARTASVTARDAVSFFMSIAPRPQT